VKYFSYGSNMSLSRLGKRIKNPTPIGTYSLPMYDLRFHKVSKKDGSGKCDAYFTGSGADIVWGRLYEIDELSKSELDKYEGVGAGYEEKIVKVYGFDGDIVEAITYVATNINESLKPYTWYKTHVLHGARDAALPESYIQKVELIDSIFDSNKAREQDELSVYS